MWIVGRVRTILQRCCGNNLNLIPLIFASSTKELTMEEGDNVGKSGKEAKGEATYIIKSARQIDQT